MKRYVLIAGVNGAGKSTLYQSLQSLKNMERVNTDEIVRSFGDWRNYSDVMKAGKIAVRMIREFFLQGISFNQETTLCGSSILRNIQTAKNLGYRIELHYVGVDTVEIAKQRIAYRVARGGHGIPDEDVERRYTESLQRLKKILPLCDYAALYDNTTAFLRFADFEKGILKEKTDFIPEWYKKL